MFEKDIKLKKMLKERLREFCSVYFNLYMENVNIHTGKEQDSDNDRCMYSQMLFRTIRFLLSTSCFSTNPGTVMA